MPSTLRFLDHRGEMAERIRHHDWAATPLGPFESWPDVLRSTLDIALASSFPTAIYWGPDLRLLYNDAWAPIPADRHPWALGRAGAEVWAEIWDVVGPQMEAVVATGQGYATYDQQLWMARDGVPRETWWNYSLTPIRDADGAVLGLLNQGNEVTGAVLARRTHQAEIDRLRELFDQAPNAVALLHGPDHVFQLANRACQALVGQRPLLGLPIAQALPEVIDQGLPDLLNHVLRSGEAVRAEARPVAFRRGDAGAMETRLLDLVCQPVGAAGGQGTDLLLFANDVTERATAEAAMRASEERLQLALDSSKGVGTWLWDVPTNRVSADARFLRLYGVDESLADSGAPISAFFGQVDPRDRPELEAKIADALRSGERFAHEYRLRQPDGSIRWVSAQGRAILDEDGQPLRFPGVSFDISERKAAEDAARIAAEELREANAAQSFIYGLGERLRSLSDITAIMEAASETLGQQLGADRVGFYHLEGANIRFGTSWASGRLKPLSGTIAQEAVGASTLALYRSGETLVSSDTTDDAALADGDIRTRAAAAIGVPLRRGGHWVASFYVNQAAPRRWTPEEIAFVEAVAEMSWDAVERADAIAALRDSEEKFRAITNSIEQMVWATQANGFHDYYNDRWYEYTGVPYGTTDGEGWADVFHPDDRERAWAVWRDSLETGEPYRIEYRLRHHDGVYRWVLGRAKPVRDAHGRITRWFGTCTDIQEIVDAREVLARSREQLEAAVEERTRQLMAAEAQLRQAQKMEALGQLTGGIAHDFNNMLAVVIGALDLLDRRVAQGRTDLDRYLTAARDGAERAAALTQRLLAFSRQQPLAPAAIDPNAMIENMIDLLIRTLGENVVVETRLPSAVHPVVADRSQLENVIVNLAVNARDAMPGGGRLAIETANVALEADQGRALGLSAGSFVEIAVRDTGLGMAPEVVQRAFDPFFTTKGVGKGTGLGLSQVFGFVRQSGGTVTIDSMPGAGTAVRVYLPAAEGATPTPTPIVDTGALPRGTAEEVVMVVEDEERVRHYSVEALRELGYTVIDARDGREALHIISRGQPISLLFSDVVMPEMTGRELAEQARARLPGLRVLLTSGYAPESAGVDEAALLAKPFDMAQLARRVRQALDAPH